MDNAEASRFHAIGHSALELWAETRDSAMEALGTEGISVTERIRDRAHGGGASTKPHRLTGPERQCSAWGRTLRIEQAVRALSSDYRDVVRYRYLHGGHLKHFAQLKGVSGPAVSQTLRKAVEHVGRDVALGDAAREALRALRDSERRTRRQAARS